MTDPVIRASELETLLGSPQLLVCDCRHDLMRPSWGREAYAESHVPGALFLDLDRDLSGPPKTDRGRHPMPDDAALNALFSRLGITAETRVVAYDQQNGAVAARLWWLLRYMGHRRAQVLDGGFAVWQRESRPVSAAEERVPQPSRFEGAPEPHRRVRIEELPRVRRLFDARDHRRYTGEVEPVDPVAGHIPGAISFPLTSNLDARGCFLAREVVREHFERAFDECSDRDAVYCCGSGVTACHLALAACYAGLDPGRVYVGSFSEWCRTPGCEVVRGPQPGGPL